MLILLYVFDALRPDHLSCYGYERATSPHLDALAADGVRFTRCYAPATWTRPSAASLLTGVYPPVHGARTRADMFSTPLPRLPEALQKLGFKTAAFSTIGNVSNAAGFGRGFDEFFDIFLDEAFFRDGRVTTAEAEALAFEDQATRMSLPLAEDINACLLPWLEANQSQADTFVFAWSIQPHVPFNPPPGFTKFVDPDYAGPVTGRRADIKGGLSPTDVQHLINLYDGEILYNDHCFGELVANLKENGWYDDALILVVGDHGEGFGEHGLFFHGNMPYEEMIRVPAIVKFPHNRHAGTVAEGLASLVDVLPTVVKLAADTKQAVDITPHAFVQGRVWEDGPGGHPAVFTETQSLDVQNRYLSATDGRWKLIDVRPPKVEGRFVAKLARYLLNADTWRKVMRNPGFYLQRNLRGREQYLFDLEQDPQETRNLYGQQPQAQGELTHALARWQAENEHIAATIAHRVSHFDEDERMKQHLADLGYLD